MVHKVITKTVGVLSRFLHRKLFFNPKINKEIIEKFNQFFSDSKVTESSKWLGIKTFKSPSDAWIYQEIIYDIKPDIIIETGTLFGGGALFLASILELIGKGQVITIDIDKDKNYPRHQRIKYLTGSSISEEIIQKVGELVGEKKVMVILDSDHSYAHVLKELMRYSQFVSIGSYLIVEDTNHSKVLPGVKYGPLEAAREFLKFNAQFVIDNSKEKFFLTYNPDGYLRRIK